MKILFLCKSNVFRSQMAEAWYRHFSPKNEVNSAALISPQDSMHALVIKAVKEFGLDLSKQYSKRLTDPLSEMQILLS